MDARCIICDQFVSAENLSDELRACPNCGTSIPPIDPAKDIKININLDELKLLTIWSDHYAQTFLDELARTELTAIFTRLKKQVDEQLPGKNTSLTLKDEIDALRENYPELFPMDLKLIVDDKKKLS